MNEPKHSSDWVQRVKQEGISFELDKDPPGEAREKKRERDKWLISMNELHDRKKIQNVEITP